MQAQVFQVEPASLPYHLDAILELFLEYASALNFDLRLSEFQEQLATIGSDYQPPRGLLLVATTGTEVAGCAAVRRLDDQMCEMRQLYVRPRWRGYRLGRRLVVASLTSARSLGYRTMRLHALPAMKSALRIYTAEGFQPSPSPPPGMLALERPL